MVGHLEYKKVVYEKFNAIIRHKSNKMAAENQFASWVKQNGGNEEFIAILASFGFTSKLALGKQNVYTY